MPSRNRDEDNAARSFSDSKGALTTNNILRDPAIHLYGKVACRGLYEACVIVVDLR